MTAFHDYNPLSLLFYFAAVLIIVMFCMNPIIIGLSLFGALMFCIFSKSVKSIKTHLFFICLLFITAIINPIFYHNGVTVLFVMNNNPITLESLIYGVSSGVMIVSVLYWFCSFSHVFTSDKLQYVFGAFSPKLSLIFSMTLRFIPLFGRQAKRVSATQKAMGLYKEDNIIDSVKGGANVFSVMVTWALENGIITADSMAARGYNTGRRSFYARYRFRKADVLLTVFTALLFAVVITALALKKLQFTYYPAISLGESGILGTAAYIAYGILVMLPAIIDLGGNMRWKYLISKI